MRTPVAVIIFNRPDAAARVFEQVARARPGKLLVIADGPRAHVEGEAEKCRAARAVVDQFDWNCEVLRNYSDVNLGVGVRPATGLRWVFEQVEEAIVLEDDCVPHETFFPFCEELLEHYRFDERVMHISGDNWNFGQSQSGFSYFFSCYCYSCGWATWRRAFRHYDPTISLWPTLRDTSWLLDILGDAEAVQFWARHFDELHTVGIERTGWDWPWLFACWAQRCLSILPATNLISNIGFSADATHTRDPNDERAFVPTEPMRFPLQHPSYVMRDTQADRRIVEQVGLQRMPQDLYHRTRRALLATLPPPVRRSLVTVRTAITRPLGSRD
jgi:hypothetical protein